VINRAHTRTDNQNLTNIWDNVTPANNAAFWMEQAGKLQNATGPWGSKTFYYDGVGNRSTEVSSVGGVTTTDAYGYPANNNRLVQITRHGDGGGAELRLHLQRAAENTENTGTVY
jgi:hypothetical protein